MSNTVKKLVVILGLIAAATISVSAAPAQQNLNPVSGKVLDAATGEGEPYVTYSIASVEAPADAAPLKMTITDENGSFSEQLPDGSYIITFSTLGKKDLTQTFTIQGSPVDLGNIIMEDDEQMIKEASVTALRKLVKMEVDKMTYSVEDDVDSKSMTMLDMLRKVPMVTVDAQDNITVNGSSSFKVYVDGKPNAMLSSNPSQMFKMMPANAFKSVEVITNPGAKYDAEGVGGVLNLITDKSSGQKAIQDGYNATVSSEVDTQGDVDGGIFLTGQKGKFSISADINLMRQQMKGINATTELQNLGADGSVLSTLSSSQDMSQTAPGLYSDVSASYEIDSLRLLTATLGIMDFRTKEPQNTAYTMTGPGGATLFTYNTDGEGGYKYASYRAGMDYQRSFAGVEGRALTASYLFSARPIDNDVYTYYHGYADDRHSDNKENSLEQTAQLDYSTPWGQGGNFSAGAKFISRVNHSDSDYFLLQSGAWTPDAGSVEFKHINNIVGTYGEYSLAREKWSGKAGVRYEHTFQQVRYLSGAGSDFGLDYGNLVPSASVQYNTGATSNIGLSYNLRISRPGIGYLNPYVNRSDISSISYGNVNLETEKSHRINLVYNFFSPVVMLNLSGRYIYCGNKISQYSFFDSEGVLNTTYGNIASEQRIGLSAFVNVNLGQKTRIYSNFDGGYVMLDSKTRGLSNSGFQFSSFTGVQHTLPWDLRLSLNFMYDNGRYQLDGHMDGMCALMGGLSKSFLDDKLSIGISGVTGFEKGGAIKIGMYTKGADYVNNFLTRVPLARVGINLSYRFGTAQNIQVKKAKHSINNDDVMQKSSGATNTGTSSVQGQ